MGVEKIKDFEYDGRKIPVYFDEHEKGIVTSWTATNPGAFYTGYVYMDNDTGEISYPEGAVVKTPTDEDRKMICKFIVIGEKSISVRDSEGVIKGAEISVIDEQIIAALEHGKLKYNK